ncbi:MAG: DUF6599 family protein [Bacteroidales bacterium]
MKKKRQAGWYYLIILLILFPGMIQAQSMERFLPESPGNDYAAENTRFYAGNKLYEYIDGGAELYLSYHYRKCISRTYVHGSEPEIITEIFDMGNSFNAYGVFSNMRETENTEYGQGCQRLKGSVLFWKDRYVVSLMTPRETSVSVETMNRIASHIDHAIPGSGSRPFILNFLSQEGLRPENILYFTHFSWQNAYYFLGSDDILMIGTKTPSVWVRYGTPERRIFLLLIKYNNQTKAKKALSVFQSSFGAGKDVKVPSQLEDGSYFSMVQIDNFLCGVFNASSKDEIAAMTGEVRKRVLEQKH